MSESKNTQSEGHSGICITCDQALAEHESSQCEACIKKAHKTFLADQFPLERVAMNGMMGGSDPI